MNSKVAVAASNPDSLGRILNSDLVADIFTPKAVKLLLDTKVSKTVSIWVPGELSTLVDKQLVAYLNWSTGY